MKNIFLALLVILVGLPSLSFAATKSPQLVAFENQLGQESQACWANLAAERDAWGKAHKSTMDALNTYGKALVDYKEKLRQGHGNALGLQGPVAPPADPAYAAFMAQQQSEKDACITKVNQEKAQFCAANPGVCV